MSFRNTKKIYLGYICKEKDTKLDFRKFTKLVRVNQSNPFQIVMFNNNNEEFHLYSTYHLWVRGL